MSTFFSDVLTSCIGAFVGFAFALIGDRLITINRKRSAIDTVLKLTKEELTISIRSIDDFNKECDKRNLTTGAITVKSVLSPFALPAREVLVNSGLFLELVNDKYFIVYQSILAAYIEMDIYASVLQLKGTDTSKSITDQLNEIKQACLKAVADIDRILK